MLTGKHSWTIALGIIAAVGLAIRVTWVLKNPNCCTGGDAYYYHYQANLLVTRHAFLEPYYLVIHKVPTSAYHPPLWALYLSAFSLVGLKSFITHRLAGALLGTATVVLVGLVGRRVGGPRVGLIAAALAAVYPLIWINDVILMSECIVLFVSALLLLFAYGLVDRPTVGRSILVGATCGLAILSRSEQVLLVVVLLVPFFLLLRSVAWRRRLTLLGVSVLAALVVVAPWVGRNLTAFHHPVLLSSNLDSTLADAYCPSTFDPHSNFYGYWDFGCTQNPNGQELGSSKVFADTPQYRAMDESDDSIVLHKIVTKFVRHHLSDLPGVMLARAGHEWSLYRPGRSIKLDFFDGRPLAVSRWGMRFYFVLLPLAFGGAFVLRRRRVMLVPLLGLPAAVTLAAVFIYGDTRFRAPAELSIVVLAAVAVDAAAQRWWPSAGRRESVPAALGRHPSPQEEATPV
jgi:4-amino-4-deoxy-L-arabinose transferase-like glycosyltransferase